MKQEEISTLAAGKIQQRRLVASTIIALSCAISSSAWGQTVTSISPASAAIGSSTVTMTVNGSGFTSGSVVHWVGTTVINLPTQLIVLGNVSYLAASVDATLLTAAGTFGVEVFNPIVGTSSGSGTTSNRVPFTVGALPTVTSVAPNTTPYNTVTPIFVSGTFAQGDQITIDGQSISTTFGSATQLQATVAQSITSVLGPKAVGAANGLGASASTVMLHVLPVISSLSPASIPAGSPAFTLTLNLTGGLTPESPITIIFNGNTYPATYVSATQATASIPASAIAAAGNLVISLTTHGETSANATFPSTSPTVTSVTPTASAANQPISLTVNGTNFVPGSLIVFGFGSSSTTITPSFINSTTLTGTVPAQLVPSAGVASVAVRNGSSGPTSNSVNIQIGNPPTLSLISPASVLAGLGPLNVTILGTGFTANSVVKIGNQTLTPASWTPTQIQVAIPALITDIPGSYGLSVLDTGSQLLSNSFSFMVILAIEASPSPITVGSTNVTLQVTATGGFIQGSSQIYWNGAPLSTQFVSAQKLTALLPNQSLTVAGINTVSVTNSSSGVVSNSYPISVQAVSPLISNVTPNNAVVNDPDTVVTITGSGFQTDGGQYIGARVLFTPPGGAAVQLTPSTGTIFSLTVTIPHSLLTTSGTATIAVINVSDKITSPPQNFTIALTPLSITSVLPASATAGSAQITVNVTGAGFDQTTFVIWTKGLFSQNLATTFVSATQLQAVVPAALMTNATTASLTVGDSRGRTSASSVTFTVNPCITGCGSNGGGSTYAITALNPSSAPVNTAVNLTITGTAFDSGNNIFDGDATPFVYFGNAIIKASSYTATQIIAAIPASALSQTGAVGVSVFLPAIDQQSNTLTFNVTGATGPSPVLLSLNPQSVGLNQTGVVLTVTGQNFVSGSVIYVNGSPSSTTYLSGTSLSTTLPPFANLGGAAIYVANPGGLTSNTVALGIFQNAGPTQLAPVLAILTPPSAAAGGPGFTLMLTGLNFAPGATVYFGSYALPSVFYTQQQLSVAIPASLIIAPQSYPVQVVNPDGTPSNTMYFTVTSQPVIITLSVSSISAGAPAFTLGVTGAGFVPGSVAALGSTPLSTTYISATSLSASVPASLVTAPGQLSVVVTNPNGGQSGPAIFTVALFALTSVGPAAADAGGDAFTITLSGIGFKNGASASFGKAGLSTTFVNATTLTAIVPASLIANPGSAPVTVTNPDGAVGGPVPFTIRNTLTLTSISPSTATSYSPATTIAAVGTGFLNGAVIVFGGTTLGTSFNSSTSLTGTIPPDLLIQLGPVAVQVMNPDGSSSNSLNFTVTPAPPPVITSISPTTAPAGGSAPVTVTITGTGFVQGSTVQFAGTSVAATLVNSSQLRVTVPASLLANAGTAGITVTNPNGDKSNSVTFTLSIPLSISQLSPAASYAGARDTALTVTGVSFANGAAVVFGSTVLGTTFVSSTQLSTTIPIAQLAQSGIVDVTVHNPDGSVSNALAFTIVALPTISVNASITATGTNQVLISLDNPALADLTGTLTLTFAANAQNTPPGYADPAMQFAAGGTSITFTIAKGSKTAVLPNNGAFSPGSVAGTLTLTITKLAAGADSILLDPAPSKSFTIPATAPGITANSVRITNGTTTGFTVEALGYSPTREVSKANLVFTTTSPIDGGGTYSVDVTQSFNAYFASANGLASGGTFKLSLPFTISGADASVVTSVSLTLTNLVGTTSPAVSGGR
jgi:hypothetical protein